MTFFNGAWASHTIENFWGHDHGASIFSVAMCPGPLCIETPVTNGGVPEVHRSQGIGLVIP